MSDLHDDPERDAVLASAYVDDDVDATQRALVESDPQLQLLVDQLREVRMALAAPLDVPSSARSAAIAAALSALDHTTQSSGTSRDDAVVRSLDRSRQRRVRWFGGAAAAAVVAIVIGLAVRDPADNEPTSASKAPATTVGAGLVQAAGGAEAGAT